MNWLREKSKFQLPDEKRNPSSELIPYYGSHDTSAKIRNQIAWRDDIKKAVWTEIAANGYITQLGLFHNNMFNQFNLASDLMEPFRPLNDRLVYHMMPMQFDHEEKMEILQLLQQEVFIAGRKEYVSNAIKIYTKSIFDALNDNDASLIRCYSIEL